MPIVPSLRRSRAGLLCSIVGLFVCLSPIASARAPSLDDLIALEMRAKQITGLSLAIVQDGRIVKARGYGFTSRDSRIAVTADTLFQAGSISKPVAAVGALRLVEAGTLSLDGDVNTLLRGWKVPENRFTRVRRVTLRRILSHSAGFTVHGFAGYTQDAAIPTLTQVLDGLAPANTPAIRVDFVPGTRWRYSGGGYTVMQQLIADVTHRPMPDVMRDLVLVPFGMTRSTYEQILPADMEALAATGYDVEGHEIRGRWRVHPELAAAGLWTTASDLSRFAIGIQQALAGTPAAVLSPPMARQMLMPQKEESGLGLFVEGRGTRLQFSHDGRNAGFDSSMIAFPHTGQGAVILINRNDNARTLRKLMSAIAVEYRWPSQ